MNQKSNRPWTPTKHTKDGLPIYDDKTYPAWFNLANKAPEMAELLISLVESCNSDEMWDSKSLVRIAIKAKELLKEVNYDV